jgi:hypothetical protein
MSSLIGLLVVAGLVAWIVSTARGGASSRDSGGHGLRRALQYSFLLAAVFTAASGATRLLISALPSDVIARRGSVELALGVSLTLVAVPVWVLLWRILARRLRVDPAERAAPWWALYLVVVTTVTLIVGFVNVVEVGRWLAGLEPFAPDALARAVIWPLLWGAHVWLLRHPRIAPTNRIGSLAVLTGSFVGLVGLAFGAADVLRDALSQLYRLWFEPPLAEGLSAGGLRSGGVLVVVALIVWWWHWLFQGVRAARDTPWHAYVLLAGVLVGALTTLVAAGVTLHMALQWWLGEPDSTRAAVHFGSLPSSVAAALVGAWLWSYHRSVVASPGLGRGIEPDRAYRYLMSGLGLLAAAAGATIAIMAAIQVLTPAALAAQDPGARNALVVAVTLLLTGAPVWWLYWRRLQVGQRAPRGDEATSPSRRAYLFLLFGVAGLTTVVSLAVLVFVILRDLLDGVLALTVLHDVRAAIALVVIAGGIAAYHWLVHRADPETRPSPGAIRHREVLLVSADDGRLARAITERGQVRVRQLHRLDGAEQPGGQAPLDLDHLAAAILAEPHERLLVTVEGDGSVRVIPYAS